MLDNLVDPHPEQLGLRGTVQVVLSEVHLDPRGLVPIGAVSRGQHPEVAEQRASTEATRPGDHGCLPRIFIHLRHRATNYPLGPLGLPTGAGGGGAWDSIG